jgi:hypothetical protein
MGATGGALSLGPAKFSRIGKFQFFVQIGPLYSERIFRGLISFVYSDWVGPLWTPCRPILQAKPDHVYDGSDCG